MLRLLAVGLTGMLLASAFPPWGGAEAAWMALVPLILLCALTPPRAAFRWGVAAGCLFWCACLTWLLRLSVTGAHWSVIAPAWLVLSFYCALYTGLFAFVLATAFRLTVRLGPTARGLLMVVLIPTVWTGLEVVRAAGPWGFPWNPLGVSQYRNLAIIQVAEWGGVYAVSFVLAMLNAALGLTALRFVAVVRRQPRARFQAELMLALLVVALCWNFGIRRGRAEVGQVAVAPSMRVAAVQPNVEQTLKWTDAHELDIYRRLARRTELAMMGRPTLVVWPETAVPRALPDDEDVMRFVASCCATGSWLLVGAMEETVLPERAYYNSSFLFDGAGRLQGTYRKQHLVPFGEYVPLDRQWPWLSRFAPLGVSCGTGATSTVFRLPAVELAVPGGGEAAKSRPVRDVLFGVLICFEDVFPRLARDAVRAGSQLLVNQTNDAWFDGSHAAVQHMSHAVFRAVENRVPIVRCANTGVTCFIAPSGEIDPPTRQAVAARQWAATECRMAWVPIRGASRPATLYTRLGDWALGRPCALLTLILFLLAIAAQRRDNRRRLSQGSRDEGQGPRQH